MSIRFVCPVCWSVREGLDDSLLGKMVKCQDCHAMSVAEHTPEPNKAPATKSSAMGSFEPVEPNPLELPAVLRPAPRSIILSTGDIPFSYEIIDLVFAHAGTREARLHNAQPVQGFQVISQMLEQTAAQIGANAVIHTRFEIRNLRRGGFEIFGYGTAVRIQK